MLTFNWKRYLWVIGTGFVIAAAGLLLIELAQVARTNAPWAQAFTRWQAAVLQTQFVVYAVMGVISGIIANAVLK